MKKTFFFFIIILIFPAACAPKVASEATSFVASPTNELITSSPTTTLTPILSTPTTKEQQFNFQEFLGTEKDRIMGMYGYANWDELALKEVQIRIDPVKDFGRGFTDPDLPYTEMMEKGLVADVVTVPVTTAYWISRGVDKVVLMEMVFSGSKGPSMVATGFIMKGGSYEATMPLKVGPDVTDWSQDVKLDSVSSLQQFTGHILAVKALDYLNWDMKSEADVRAKWAKLQADLGGKIPIAIRHFDILSDQAQALFEAAVVNLDGYADHDTGLSNTIEMINKGEIPDYPIDKNRGRFFALATWYLDWSNKEDAWILGTVVSDEFGKDGLMYR